MSSRWSASRTTPATSSCAWSGSWSAARSPTTSTPSLTRPTGSTSPRQLDAFLDAVRWGAIASADKTVLQAPFRSGIEIEDYQLDPVVRALSMPRTNLLIADDVGLGKTIEAGLVMQELMLRHRARTMLIVCPAGLTLQWRDEMRDKFGLEFRIVDTACSRSCGGRRGLYANPWTHYPRLIVSVDWLKRDRPDAAAARGAAGRAASTRAPSTCWSSTRCTPARPQARGKYAVDSLRTQAIRTLAPHCEHRLFLSATPHNGYLESFTALLELLDDQRFARGVKPNEEQLARIMVRRLKRELPPNWDGTPRFPSRVTALPEVEHSADEREAHRLLTEYAASRAARRAGRRRGQRRRRLRHHAAEEAPVLLAEGVRRDDRDPPGDDDRPAGLGGRPPRLPTPSRHARPAAAGRTPGGDRRGRRRLRRAPGGGADRRPPAGHAAHPRENVACCERLGAWARQAQDRPDPKFEALRGWLDRSCGPAQWSPERVIVFTEYRDTQRWLYERLLGAGYPPGADRPALRRPGRGRARAHQGRLPGATRTSTRCASCWPPTPRARASTCRPTATGCCTGRSRGTRTGWSSATAASTGTASPRPR